MEGRINSTGAKVLVVALVSLVLGVSQGLTADWSSILKEARAKYAKFEKEIKDMTIVQETKMTTPQGEMTSGTKILKKGKKFRMETTMQMQMPGVHGGMKTITIFDGKDTWMISPMMGKRKLSAEEEKKYQTEKNWWEVISEKAKIVGTEKVGNRDSYVVEFKEGKEFPFTKIWIDKKNLFLAKAESKGPKGKTMLWVFSDFRKIKRDYEMPYKTEMYVGGKLMSTNLVKSIEINKGLSDDLFNPEKVKVKGFSMQEMMKKMMKKGEGEKR